MRITSLALENFRSYDRLQLQFSDRTLIIGENGAGKSTVPDAIALALLGRCRGVNRKGEGQRELIRSGAEEAIIRLIIDGSQVITRTLNQKTGAQSSPPPDHVLARLNASDDLVEALIYGGTFFDLHHADAKKLLMRLLNVRVPVPADRETSEGGTDLLTLDQCEEKYKFWFNERTSVKRAIDALAVPDVTRRVDLEQLDADICRQRVRDTRLAYEAAVNATADARAKGKTLRDAADRLARKAADLPTLQTKRIVHADSLKQHQDLEVTAKGKLDALDAERQAEPGDTLTTQVEELKLFVNRIDAHNIGDKATDTQTAICVLGQGIPCLTPPKEFTAKLTKAKRDIAALEKKIKAGTKRAEAIAAASQSLRDEQRNIGYHAGQLNTIDQDIADDARRRNDLDQLRDELADVEPLAATGDQQIEEASAALAAAQSQDRDRQVYAQALVNRENALVKQEQLKADLLEAERWVKLLGPTGARADALQTAVDDFHQAINAALAPFGFELAINVDPWLVRVLTPTTKGALPYQLLSKGQKLWTGLALQLALAAVSGLNFCVIDDVDGVVGQNLKMLTALVMTAPVDQVLIIKAQADDQAAPELPGLQVVRVHEARAEVGAGARAT